MRGHDWRSVLRRRERASRNGTISFGPMPGTLFVVATPIGNLEDITLRALRVMREADLIAAEDTRRTAKLLTHYAISTPTISFHEHNSRTRVPQLLARTGSRGQHCAGERCRHSRDRGSRNRTRPGVLAAVDPVSIRYREPLHLLPRRWPQDFP